MISKNKFIAISQQSQAQNVVYNTKARDASQQRVSLLTSESNVMLYEVMNQVGSRGIVTSREWDSINQGKNIRYCLKIFGLHNIVKAFVLYIVV